MIQLKVECPHCRRSLLDSQHLISGAPSVALIGQLPKESGDAEGVIRLSSYYGDYQIDTSLVIPEDTVVKFSCPYCHTDLTCSRSCDICHVPMVALQLEKGGRVLFCSRRGSKEHFLEFDDPENDLAAFYREHMPSME